MGKQLRCIRHWWGRYSNTPYEDLLKHIHTVLTAFKETIILIDGKRVKLQLWDTSGQGRFCTIIRSYSRGAQGILLVYDITNKWSFEGISRWLHEVDHVRQIRVLDYWTRVAQACRLDIFMKNHGTQGEKTLKTQEYKTKSLRIFPIKTQNVYWQFFYYLTH